MIFKELRMKKGLTQEDVARALGIAQSTVAMWETGGSTPTNENLIKLADLFKCSTDKLLGRR